MISFLTRRGPPCHIIPGQMISRVKTCQVASTQVLVFWPFREEKLDSQQGQTRFLVAEFSKYTQINTVQLGGVPPVIVANESLA